MCATVSGRRSGPARPSPAPPRVEPVRSPLLSQHLTGHLLFQEGIREQLLQPAVFDLEFLKPLASDTLMPPNLLRHRSFTGSTASASRRKPTIWASGTTSSSSVPFAGPNSKRNATQTWGDVSEPLNFGTTSEQRRPNTTENQAPSRTRRRSQALRITTLYGLQNIHPRFKQISSQAGILLNCERPAAAGRKNVECVRLGAGG